MTYAITDCRISRECELNLMRQGIKLIRLPAFSKLSEAVASHTDLLMLRLGDELISSAAYCEEAEEVFESISRLFPHLRFSFTDGEVGAEYPCDCSLNALIMGDKMFCNVKSISTYVKERAEGLGLEIIPVKQGYPACTVLKLTDDSAITSDRGMAKKLASFGIRVALIDDGGILLPPYRYGFIGGAGGVLDNKLFLTGDISTHPSYNIIKSAVRDAGLDLVFLSRDLPLDVGGILFISQNIDYNGNDRH